MPQADLVFYELHVGTFTPAGTFTGVIEKLPYLRELGMTAVEIMPVAAFPGDRNWGYDGVFPYAPHVAYGGPDGLKALVDACHAHGLALFVDVVYNHLGPEGNYVNVYGPYFSDRYRTPWGDALNFDGPDSDDVRRYFIENALHWLVEYHVDGLRLDAIHGIFDFGPRHMLQEMAERFHAEAHRLGRRACLVAESDLNDPRVIRPPQAGGWGMDAQWSDDFHHALHAMLTGARLGYFSDFGRPEQLAKAITSGFVYDGQRSPFRRRQHGAPAGDEPGERFVSCIQNHDQVANGYQGRRLAKVAGTEKQKIGAALLLSSPMLPLLFQGEEYAEEAPFDYFTSHTDPALVEAVRVGRHAEYEHLLEAGVGMEAWSDPQDPATFERSKLRWETLDRSPHAETLAFYRAFLGLRQRLPPLRNGRRDLTRVDFDPSGRWISVHRGDPGGLATVTVANLTDAAIDIPLPTEPRPWRLALSSTGKNAPEAVPGRQVSVPATSALLFVAGEQGAGE